MPGRDRSFCTITDLSQLDGSHGVFIRRLQLERTAYLTRSLAVACSFGRRISLGLGASCL